MLAVIPYPALDPHLVVIPGFALFGADWGPFPIRWYALAYIAGLLLGWKYINLLLARPSLWPGGKAPMTKEHNEALLFWMVPAIIIGGRLGFVLFYDPSLLWTFGPETSFNLFGLVQIHLPRAVAIWAGGMSFHGGLLLATIGVIIFARSYRAPVLSVGDAAAAAAPFGIFFGRIANFVNGELWGRPTDAPWAMVFPNATLVDGENLPRHPSQLYEAALEGLLIAGVLYFLIWKTDALRRPGYVAGMFFVCYGLARGFVEFFRQWDLNIGPDAVLLGTFITRGQLLCVPMIFVGWWLIRRSRNCAP